jgi:hypothetical protein
MPPAGMSRRSQIGMILIVLVITSLFITEGYLSHKWDYDDIVYTVNDGKFQYDLAGSHQRYTMPKDLEEISALSIYGKSHLACLQDEDGVLFFYNFKKQQISRTEKFGKKGDYEGLEIVGRKAYVLRSDGKIYTFDIKNDRIGEVSKLDTDLSSENDTEGLGYDKTSNELLIACKAKPDTKNAEVKGKTVYAYNLTDHKFHKEPRYRISKKKYHKFLDEKNLSKKKHSTYKPSAIAVHPVTENIYIIGSVGKMLTILNRQNEILDLIPLNPKVFRQPEGICFDDKGVLFIASEGAGEKGYVLQFSNISK